ncbi:MAG: TlpA family protein disulfide reductase [Gemmataceae bacterium]
MNRTRLGLFLLPLFSLGLVGCGDANANAPIKMKPVTYAEFENIIAQNKGKVVVVDFWAEFCGPCKDGMPHLVEMQKEFGKDGLVIVTLNIDNPMRPETIERAEQFLTAQGAGALINLTWNTEDLRAWRDHMNFDGIPHTYVYNRDGQKVEEFSGLQTQNVHKLVEELLKKTS